MTWRLPRRCAPRNDGGVLCGFVSSLRVQGSNLAGGGVLEITASVGCCVVLCRHCEYSEAICLCRHCEHGEAILLLGYDMEMTTSLRFS